MYRAIGGVLLAFFVPLLVLAWRDEPPKGTAVVSSGHFQPEKKSVDESSHVSRALNNLTKPPETERDKFVEEITKAFGEISYNRRDPADEFGRWFDRLADGGRVWRESEIPRKGLRELYDRMAERLENTSGEITREQFLRYGADHLGADSSPRWSKRPPRTPSSEARRVFDRLDRDQDGSLSPDERPAELRRVLLRWDRDGDGRIDPEEYERYFHSRLRAAADEQGIALPGSEAKEESRPMGDPDRPSVYRAGRLPANLPEWFAEVDEDEDGQIGLYEWKQASREVREFQQVDLNGDGFLTVEELLRVLRQGSAEKSDR